jgi:hypothetical protein
VPRTGLPELFETNGDYDAYIRALVRSGVMEDSSYVYESLIQGGSPECALAGVTRWIAATTVRPMG